MYGKISGMINEAAPQAGQELGSGRTVQITQVLTAVCPHVLAVDHSDHSTDGLTLCRVVGWDFTSPASICSRYMGLGQMLLAEFVSSRGKLL